MAWGAIGGAVASAVVGGVMGGGGGGGGGSTSQTPYYQPKGLSMAYTGWRSAYGGAQDIANTVTAATAGPYGQSLAQQQAINYTPYLQAANQAGSQYDWLANLAGMQGQQYGQQAALSGGKQQNLYNAAN